MFRHSRPAGQREVRLELEPAPGAFLSFPVWAWDTVFCGDYLAPTAEEYAQWSTAVPLSDPDEDPRALPEPWRSRLEASWSRIFDHGLPGLPWDPMRIGQRGSREAVLGILRLEDVRRVTPFVENGRAET